MKKILLILLVSTLTMSLFAGNAKMAEADRLHENTGYEAEFILLEGELASDLTVQEALRLAVQKENAAFRIYISLLRVAQDDEAIRTFTIWAYPIIHRPTPPRSNMVKLISITFVDWMMSIGLPFIPQKAWMLKC